MRTLVFLALMAVPAWGFSLRDVLQNKYEADELPQARGTNEQGTKSVRRQLKGSSSSKGKGKGKGGRSPRPLCETIAVWTLQQDYTRNGVLLGDFGEALEGLPVYEQRSNRIIATITESVVDAGEDCTAVGSINFGLRSAEDGRTRDQLLYQGTCSGGLTNAVTGGTGDFTGAKGLLQFTGQRANRFLFELTACDTLGIA